MKNLLRYELCKIYNRSTTWILLVLSAAIAVIGIIYRITDRPWIEDVSKIFSMCEASLIRDTAFGLVMLSIIIPMFSTLICSDTYYREYLGHSDVILIIKHGRCKYFISKSIVIIVFSFTISILPFLLNQLLCQIIFPIHTLEVDGGYYLASNFSYELSRIPYLDLYYNNPLLYNYIHILFVGIYGSILGLLSYVFSLYFKRKNILVMLSFSTIISFSLVLFAVTIEMNHMVIIYYLLALPTIKDVNIPLFFDMLIGLFIMCVVGLVLKIIRYRDVI